MTIDRQRLVRLVVFGAWAAYFDWMWLSGEWSRFIGPRTAWVVPFGAIALTLLTLAYAPTVLTRRPGGRVGAVELLALAALLAPVAAMLTVPDASLGSLAVSRKQAGRALSGLVRKPAPGMMSVAAANEEPDSAASFGVTEGKPIDIVAFVSTPPATAGAGFDVSRFYTACCAADAVPVTVHLIPAQGAVQPSGYKSNDWLKLHGVVARTLDGRWYITGTALAKTSKPKNPYLPY
jgi:uncharacterized membrane protein YcgQ (UPF0703/DUF1980 family)